jgi:hypothetical protein
MRILQFHSFYKDYLDAHYNLLNPYNKSYSQLLNAFIEERYHSVHILLPAYSDNINYCLRIANDPISQFKWAEERQISTKNLKEILLAQIEEFKPDVIYSLDPVYFGADFIQRLPKTVKLSICWFAAMGSHPGVQAYDLRVCNFRGFLDSWRKSGLDCDWFSPSVDSAMPCLAYKERDIDIAFVGQYSHYHKKRNELLERLAIEFANRKVHFALLHPKWKKISERRILNRIPTFMPYLGRTLRQVATNPVYGRELYSLFSRSRIVINAAIDLAEADRGNMRCFEAMGCGATMLSDAGRYPANFRPNEDFLTFSSIDEAVHKIKLLINDSVMAESISLRGKSFVDMHYSKVNQWSDFLKICEKWL